MPDAPKPKRWNSKTDAWCCIECERPFQRGDKVYNDVAVTLHVACLDAYLFPEDSMPDPRCESENHVGRHHEVRWVEIRYGMGKRIRWGPPMPLCRDCRRRNRGRFRYATRRCHA